STDACSFALVMTELADRFCCIAYDLPTGRGDGANLSRYRHADLVSDLFALLDHLRANTAFPFGFSFGSTIALAALRPGPNGLPRAVRQGGFAHIALAPAEAPLARLLCHGQAPLGSLPFREPILRRGHYAPFADQPPEVWRYFIERCGAPPV